MKKIILSTMMLIMVSCQIAKYQPIEAEVLSINENVLRGEMISHFLSGSSGWLKGDLIIVGIKFNYNNIVMLEDISINHAILVEYKDYKSLPIEVKVFDSYLKVLFHNKIVLIRKLGYREIDRLLH